MEQLWERGWDGHERAQLKRQAALPFADKLQWLEDAHHMALALQKSREDQQARPESQPESPASTCTELE